MSNGIENKVVIIAGASSGIGEATTRRLAKDGAKLVIGARREANIRSTLISPGLVNTELYTTISDKKVGESLKNASEIPGVGLTADDVAEAVAYAVGTPETVAVSEIILRPTKQVI